MASRDSTDRCAERTRVQSLVAIQAGARSALGTLWSVNDLASAELVGEFYGQLHAQPVSKAMALQRAQQKLVRDVNHGHPYYRAPFLLIGNWL